MVGVVRHGAEFRVVADSQCKTAMSGREEEEAIDSSKNAAEENGGSEKTLLMVEKEVGVMN